MLRDEIIALVHKYYNEQFAAKVVDPIKQGVKYASRVFNDQEIVNAVEACLDFWLTEGRFCEDFARRIADFLSVNNVILTNSGSSANLLAFSALTSRKLGSRALQAGDEVIAVAAGFPSTVTPIIQNQMIPVFVDVSLPTYNIDVTKIEAALSPRTKCIFLAHTLGNPYDMDAILEIVRKHDLWLVEDNCDAFGSMYKGKLTGKFGHISTISFYPAHHITTGEGGAIVTDDDQLAQIIRSFRDWGRDCYCAGGENNTCGKRFTQQFGTLPLGYDHKYVYSELGYNLKMTEMQAAIGVAQMDKLPSFTQKRKANFSRYFQFFKSYEKYFILPEATPGSDPSWFTFILSVREDAPFGREELLKFLSERKIETRNIFAGNLTRQPAFEGRDYRISGDLAVTDFIMNRSFFLGVYPGLTEAMFQYVEEAFREFIAKHN